MERKDDDDDDDGATNDDDERASFLCLFFSARARLGDCTNVCWHLFFFVCVFSCLGPSLALFFVKNVSTRRPVRRNRDPCSLALVHCGYERVDPQICRRGFCPLIRSLYPSTNEQFPSPPYYFLPRFGARGREKKKQKKNKNLLFYSIPKKVSFVLPLALVLRQRDAGRQGHRPRRDLGVVRVRVLAVLLLESRLVVDLHSPPGTLVGQISVIPRVFHPVA